MNRVESQTLGSSRFRRPFGQRFFPGPRMLETMKDKGTKEMNEERGKDDCLWES